MSSIMEQIEVEHLELFALELRKLAESCLCLHSSIYESAPYLVKMYVTIRSRVSLIMDLIEPELPDLSAIELENLPYLTLFTLASVNIDHSVPNLATICMPMRSQICSIMGQIQAEHPELYALEFGKIAESDFVYILASTNINQSAPNFVKMYVTIRSRISSIMDLIRPELFELFAL